MHFVRTDQALGLGNAHRELLPPDSRRHGSVQIGGILLGGDQGGAELGQQAHLVVHRAGVAQDGAFLARLGTTEHAADCPVEQADTIIGQACRGIQHGRDQGRSAAKQ